jgi:hypothetical protein
VKEFFRNAFALDDGKPCEPSPEQRAVLERLSAEIAKRRMTGPALAFLEMSRPLNGLGAAVVQFFTPIASILARPESLRDFAAFLEKRGSIDVLCGMLEAAETARTSGCCEGAPVNSSDSSDLNPQDPDIPREADNAREDDPDRRPPSSSPRDERPL